MSFYRWRDCDGERERRRGRCFIWSRVERGAEKGAFIGFGF